MEQPQVKEKKLIECRLCGHKWHTVFYPLKKIYVCPICRTQNYPSNFTTE